MAHLTSTLLSVPTVTEGDLQDFHARHFSPTTTTAFTSRYLPTSHRPPNHQPDPCINFDDDDDGLGHYPDGVKRTLTDEQIAIFRHSEVESLLREQRRARERRENADVDESPGERNGGDRRSVKMRSSASSCEIDGDHGGEDKEEAEYVEFLRREARELGAPRGIYMDQGMELVYDDDDDNEGGMREEVSKDIRQNQESVVGLESRRRVISYDDDEDDDGITAGMSSTRAALDKKMFIWPKIGA